MKKNINKVFPDCEHAIYKNKSHPDLHLLSPIILPNAGAEKPRLPKKYKTYLYVLLCMGAWYTCSLVTLFLNKSLLTRMSVPVHVLGLGQMITTCCLGAAKVYCGVGNRPKSQVPLDEDQQQRVSCGCSRWFIRNIALVGLMRGATVILGLVSLQHVAASFTEAIKASAPLFTVLFAWLILGEKTPNKVIASLIPIMIGLVITSGTELSFDTVGFLAAMCTNMIDCTQNVFSKRLMERLTPVQLQFYTSVSAIVMQLPMMLYNNRVSIMAHLNGETSGTFPIMVIFWLLVACVFYHLQSVSAYYCVDAVSPVTMSVSNTLKRGLLILASIAYFGNRVGISTAIGMIMIVVGVAIYNRVRS